MWLIDTCVLIDVLEADPMFGIASAELLFRLRDDGLAVSPVTHVELAPAFDGNPSLLRQFLGGVGAKTRDWGEAETSAAFDAWQRHVQAKRAGRATKRPIADILIGASASTCRGLLTRNPDDFQPWFPHLQIRTP